VTGRIPLGKPEDRVKVMIDVINRFTLKMSGSFVAYDGEELPW